MATSLAKENILRKIRQALSNPVPLPFAIQESSNLSVFKPQEEDLAVLFAENFKTIQGNFSFCNNENDLLHQMSSLIQSKKWEKIFCREENIKSLLSKNKSAIFFLSQNPHLINWNSLSQNTNAYEILKNNINKINWTLLSSNENSNCLKLLINKPYLIDWKNISGNPNAIEIIKNNKNKINWDYLSINPHPEAIELLRNNIDKINWNNISLNQSYLAMKIIKDNLNKINWYFLSSNKFAIELLIENKDLII